MERLLWVLGLLAVCVLAGYGMYLGWRHRGARHSGLATRAVTPADLGPDLVTPVPGLYISTTTAGNWQDRIVAQGLGRRAAGALRLSAEGVCIEREGESDIFVPTADLVAVDTSPGVAGKVMGMSNGVLIVRWSLGEATLESGFRAGDDELQADFIDAAENLIRRVAGPTTTAGPTAAAGTNDPPSTNGAP